MERWKDERAVYNMRISDSLGEIEWWKERTINKKTVRHSYEQDSSGPFLFICHHLAEVHCKHKTAE